MNDPIKTRCEDLILVFAACDVGGADELTYKALIEVADWVRRAHEWAPYTATGVLTVTEMERNAIAAEKLRQQRLMN